MIWYLARYGREIWPYTDLPDAVSSWPTTATAIALRASDRLVTDTVGVGVIAPFGFGDLTRLKVRANRVEAPEAVYSEKAARWRAIWPGLHVLSWNDGIGQPASRWR